MSLGITAANYDSAQPAQAPVEEVLRNEIVDAFKRCGYRELERLEIEVKGRDVILRGTLPNYYLRQKAAALVMSNPTVATLHTAIKMAPVMVT